MQVTNMSKVFKWIGDFMEKKPIKILVAAFVLIVIFISGVSNMRLATGNETLVKGDNEAYLINKQMEASFGGDAIMVLFTDQEEGNLFSLENIRKMRNVEQKFQFEENIFSFTSPAGIVHQMAEKQGIEIKKQVLTLSVGLEEMASKMSGLALAHLPQWEKILGMYQKGLVHFMKKAP